MPWLLNRKFFVHFVLHSIKESFMFHYQGYSWEVTTAEGGQGLNELLSSRKSVLNGTYIWVFIFCSWTDHWNRVDDTN